MTIEQFLLLKCMGFEVYCGIQLIHNTKVETRDGFKEMAVFLASKKWK